jgi:hypothetical protein
MPDILSGARHVQQKFGWFKIEMATWLRSITFEFPSQVPRQTYSGSGFRLPEYWLHIAG